MESILSFFTVNNLLMMNIGIAVGILIGAAPGLSAVSYTHLTLPTNSRV